ncbi:bifunctional DNA-formamidopyrimidine glycosylase/DNA-(apurinic or apyrimidinic site) lyase [Timonella sp. A28]|uniref:bifunctional DNA-formamidopyrimidine glycosylase/DNA-(apurinic or apyrimidinic site) lyase n=1 Tax=Timonella sp. A28 TaxID=3442640 RepID=UPI003EBA6FFE
MPELPEVETVREGLERHVVGRTIRDVSVLRDYSVRRHEGGPHDFVDRLRGETIEYVARRGKFLWLGFTGSDEALVGHLGMSGQLLVKDANEQTEPHRHLRVRMTLEGSAHQPNRVFLDFVDQRTFGYLAVSDLAATPDEQPGGLGTQYSTVPDLLGHISRDLLDPTYGPETPGRNLLNKKIRSKQAAIKRILLDQSVVSGIGNIYADEALWRARIHGERPANKLTRKAVDELLSHAHDVMSQALVQGGTSFDALYVNVNGESGYFDRSLNAYGQEGHPCGRCGTTIERVMFMNRSSFFCPKCQRK